MEEEGLIQFLNSEGEELEMTSSQIQPLTEDLTYPVSKDKLRELLRQVRENGPSCLIQNYKEVLNVQRNLRRTLVDEHSALITALDIIQEGMNRMKDEFNTNDPEHIRKTEDKQRELRKYVAVLMFLFRKLVFEIETQSAAEKARTSFKNGTQKKGFQLTITKNSVFSFWVDKRKKLLSTFRTFLSHPLTFLWVNHPEMCRDQVFRCGAATICCIVKNSVGDLLKDYNGGLHKDVHKIFGILCDQYKQGNSLITKLVDLLKMGEEFGKILCSCLCKIENGRICKNMIVSAIRLAAETFDKKSQSGLATFLIQIGKNRPGFCFEASFLIKHFLTLESPSTTRNAVLTLVAELLSWDQNRSHSQSWSETEDSDTEIDAYTRNSKITSIREDLFEEVLLFHTMDLNANVRCKALKLLGDLISWEKLNSHQITAAVLKTVNRLRDSMPSVRKAAIRLFREVVTVCPLSIKFSYDHFKDDIGNRLKTLMMLYTRENVDTHCLLKEIVHKFHDLLKYGYANICLDKHGEKLKEQLKNLDKISKKLLLQGLYWEACEIRFTGLMILRETNNNIDDVDEEDPSETIRVFFQLIDIKVEEGELNLSVGLDLDTEEITSSWDVIKLSLGWMGTGKVLRNSMHFFKDMLVNCVNDEVIQVIQLFDCLGSAGYELSEFMQNIICAVGKVVVNNEKAIPEVMEMFKRMYFPRTIRATDLKMVKRLLLLVRSIPSDVKETLGVIIKKLHQSDFICNGVVEKLWDAFSLNNDHKWTENDSIHAAFLLGVISRQDRENLKHNMRKLAHIGLGQRALENHEFAESVLEAIIHACPGSERRNNNSKADHDMNLSLRLPPSDQVFVNILKLMETGLKTAGDETKRCRFPNILTLCVRIIYKLNLKPENAVGKILDYASNTLYQNDNQPQFNGMVEGALRNLEEWRQIWYLSLMPAILGSHLLFSEKVIIPELQYRKKQIKPARYCAKSSWPSLDESTNSSSRNSLDMNISCPSVASSDRSQQSVWSSTSDAVMLGSAGHDADVERVRTCTENLMDTQGTFQQFRIITFDVCNNMKTHSTVGLKNCAVKALLKIMKVSCKDANQGVKILNQIWDLEDETLNSVKVVIAMNSPSVILKYPNQMEELIKRFITGLQHSDKDVRLACLDVIVYLRLGDLLKSHDVLSAVALRLCDESGDIKDAAIDFFNEITSHKGNNLTNYIPEIISDIIANDKLSKDDIEDILRFILRKVDRKQVPALVDRIINKFKTTPSGRKCAILAFSLTVFCHNEKTITSMTYKIDSFSDKLDTDVCSHFMTVIEAVKKTASGTLFAKVEEFHLKLGRHRKKWLQIRDIEKFNDNARVLSRTKQIESDSDSESPDEMNTNITNGESESSDEENISRNFQASGKETGLIHKSVARVPERRKRHESDSEDSP